MSPQLQQVEPKAPRWVPTADPQDIVVPGLDTTASINDQIEQLEQLITIKLQNIDNNFSKIQQTMANRILPAVKRYAVGTEPVRDAAKFWITFFEQAAQIRVPMYDEYSVHDTPTDYHNEASEEQSSEEQSNGREREETRSVEPDVTSAEVSFSLGQVAISSTPARRKSHAAEEPTPSWSASMESPLVRLDRDIQSFVEEDRAVATSSTSRIHPQFVENSEADVTQRQMPLTSVVDSPVIPSESKGKGKQLEEPLLRGVLRRNVDVSAVTDRPAPGVSPLKVRASPPVSKSTHPPLSQNVEPSDWKGVADLTAPRVRTPSKSHSPAKRLLNMQAVTSKRPSTPRENEDDESFDEGLGMSPPIMMDFARLPKAKTPKLGRTPRKEAAERIMRSLVHAEKSSSTLSSARIDAILTRSGLGGPGGMESSMSTVPSPPSLSKYTSKHKSSGAETSHSLADASLESMMRRVGLNIPGFGAGTSSSTAVSGDPYGSAPTSALPPPATSQGSAIQAQSNTQIPVIDFSRVRVDDDEYGVVNTSLDSDDSFEEVNDTANPSAAFLMAAQRPSFDDGDDSFDSNDNDSIDFADAGAMVNLHPFGDVIAVQEGDSFDDDSFNNDPVFDQQTEEETLFGVPPAQRLQAHAAFRNRMSSAHLQLHGEGLLDNTLGIGAQMAQAGRIEETPTPASGTQAY